MACVIRMCNKLQSDAPFEFAGKRKRWDASAEHLLIAKALREALDNNTIGFSCCSTIAANGATIDAACGLHFAPKLKEFLYVASAKMTTFNICIISIYERDEADEKFHCSCCALISQALRPLHIYLFFSFFPRWKSPTANKILT